MAENMENQVIDVEENTGLATTAPAQNETEKPADKVGIIGKVCAGIAVVTGLVSIGLKGYQKSKRAKTAKSSNEDNVVEAEPTSNEDEVQE